MSRSSGAGVAAGAGAAGALIAPLAGVAPNIVGSGGTALVPAVDSEPPFETGPAAGPTGPAVGLAPAVVPSAGVDGANVVADVAPTPDVADVEVLAGWVAGVVVVVVVVAVGAGGVVPAGAAVVVLAGGIPIGLTGPVPPVVPAGDAPVLGSGRSDPGIAELAPCVPIAGVGGGGTGVALGVGSVGGLADGADPIVPPPVAPPGAGPGGGWAAVAVGADDSAWPKADSRPTASAPSPRASDVTRAMRRLNRGWLTPATWVGTTGKVSGSAAPPKL